MEKQLVVFSLASEDYGIEIAVVESIIKMQDITKMPRSPAFVEGVINLRGVVLPVIDLAKRFGITECENNRDTRIVIVNIKNMKIGMIVSAVSEVLTIDDSVIESTPSIVTTVNSNFVSGIARLDSRLIILLDISKILTREESLQTASLYKE
ncbi:MAG: chemotaxis protein CheW [Leptolinea sp.]|jgi:purine-binding chemotaxis protein CheW|nr:chemotaxis protein CheW [Leptolinea sp.]